MTLISAYIYSYSSGGKSPEEMSGGKCPDTMHFYIISVEVYT